MKTFLELTNMTNIIFKGVINHFFEKIAQYCYLPCHAPWHVFASVAKKFFLKLDEIE